MTFLLFRRFWANYLQAMAPLDDKYSMAKRTKLVAEALRNGLSRLADVGPTEFWVLSEDTDWLLVGEDLRSAIATEAPAEQIEDDEELVEA